MVKDNMGEAASDEVTVSVVLPPNNYNWVKETTALKNNILTIDTLNAASIIDGKKSVAWNYFDGIGRLSQQISVQGSPAGQDIVIPTKYDEFGREYVKYLPYVNGSNGQYKTDALNGAGTAGKLFDFYSTGGNIAVDTSPMAVTIFESSPLNRVTKQGGTGAAWQPASNHTVRTAYLLNKWDEILKFSYDNNTYEISLTEAPPDSTAFYEANTLMVTKTTDEEQSEVFEYVDKEGRTICKKVKAADGIYAFTYYIYDDFGNLVVVLPPEAVDRIINDN